MFIFIEIYDPINAPKIPHKHIGTATFKFIFLFFKLTIIAVIAVGIKNIIFVACAMCCSIPKNRERNSINTVPPPIPSPPTIPAAIPIKISIT